MEGGSWKEGKWEGQENFGSLHPESVVEGGSQKEEIRKNRKRLKKKVSFLHPSIHREM